MLDDIEKITDDDRDVNQNLTEAGREKAIRAIKKILLYYGTINYGRIGEKIGVSYPTAKALVKKVIDEWKEDVEDRAIVQAKFFENLAIERLEHPEKFTDEFKLTISEVTALLNRSNALAGLITDKATKQDELELRSFLKAWSTLNTRTQSLLDQKKIAEQQNNAEDGTTTNPPDNR
jgi:hypothetical protein